MAAGKEMMHAWYEASTCEGDLYRTVAIGNRRSPKQELPPTEDGFAWLHVGDSFITTSYREAKQSFDNDRH